MSQASVVGVAIAPGDVAADETRLRGVVGMVGAGQGEVAQGAELRLDEVQPGGVVGGVDELDVVGGGPVSDPAVASAGPMRAEVVEHEGQAHLRRMERADVAAEGEELGAPLVFLDVPVEAVAREVVGGQ